MPLLPPLSQQLARRMRNRPLKELALGRACPGPLPTQCGSPTDHNVRPLSWVRRRAFMVRWDSNECLWALSGSQRAGTILAFTGTLMGAPLVECACFDLCSDVGCPLHVFITRGWGFTLQAAKVKFSVCTLCVFVLQNPKTSCVSFKFTVTFYSCAPLVWPGFIMFHIK